MIEFEQGSLHSTGLCYNDAGRLVMARSIPVGAEAWTSMYHRHLGKRVR